MQTQIKRKVYRSENVSESDNPSVTQGLKSVGEDVMKGFWEQFLKGSTQDVSSQIGLNTQPSQNGHAPQVADMAPGQEVVLKKAEKKAEHKAQHNREYFAREVQVDQSQKTHGEQMMIKRQVEEILIELKKLTKTSSEMGILFKEVSVEEVPVEAGTYHVHFFEWVLSVVTNARKRVEEGATWLQMFASKKQQKQYWNQFKKHGTSFGLSSERSTATQTG